MSLKEDAEWLWSKACFLSIQDMKSYGNFRGFSGCRISLSLSDGSDSGELC